MSQAERAIRAAEEAIKERDERIAQLEQALRLQNRIVQLEEALKETIEYFELERHINMAAENWERATAFLIAKRALENLVAQVALSGEALGEKEEEE